MVSMPLAALLFLIPPPEPAQSPAPPPPAVVEYGDAYRFRATVHKIGSFAMLPLAGAEFLLGEKLYKNGGETLKGAHVGVGAAIGTLFAANTVTGVWNLVEARHDPNGRTKRWAHALLMLTADACFLATAALAPGEREEGRTPANFSDRRALHRTMALSSLAVGTIGYLVMLLNR
jgi:hypothetical protein